VLRALTPTFSRSFTLSRGRPTVKPPCAVLACLLAAPVVGVAISRPLAQSAPHLSGSFDPKLFAEMRWRSVGPFRGGRAKSITGVPRQPNVFYTGVVNGGVWKTNDYGRTWTPIFDDQPTGSLGSVAVDPPHPDTVY